MFKKTEETEWTRFSKALSSREREETETGGADDAAPTVSQPAVSRNDPALPPPPARQMASDVSVSSRSVARPAVDPGEDEIESTIGAHTNVDGSFKSENSIRIRGTVQGEIESRRAILVDEEANVTAKVTAENVTVAGQVSGQIYCSGRVEIRPSGRVVGEINAGTLIMQEGAFFEGHLKMGGQSSMSSEQVTEGAPAKR
jgi:cytoskeletal protein CcmA (bactofilin family)